MSRSRCGGAPYFYTASEQWFHTRKPGDLIVVRLGDGSMEEVIHYFDWLHTNLDRSKIEKSGTAREWCIEHGIPLVSCPGHHMAVIAPITDDQEFEARMRWRDLKELRSGASVSG